MACWGSRGLQSAEESDYSTEGDVEVEGAIRDMYAALSLIMNGGGSLIVRVVKLCTQLMTISSPLSFRAK
jgi:hypothetical protein